MKMSTQRSPAPEHFERDPDDPALAQHHGINGAAISRETQSLQLANRLMREVARALARCVAAVSIGASAVP
ncbi:hypothetical protein, partial [Xanthobacter versatilis]|uniref:hypothetical protein n=1 Tax=Xanthobacter autotrophicus (strain ATCC BAA-1158 / Py2) TaxID=78245 RepID=UPI00372646BB